MSYTSFGEFVRILRIRNHMVMGDMAKILNTSIPFLSAVENGKKNVPSGWLEKITTYFQLSEEEHNELEEAIDESKIQYRIPMENANILHRKVALQFARSFDELDDDTALRILNLLKHKEENKKNGL